jgi:5-deoxy-D-glucuronate isomerase
MTPHEPNYRTIPLTRGMCAVVDAKNFEDLNKWKWFALKAVKRGRVHFYAARSTCHAINGPGTVLMHRHILGLQKGDRRQGDHREPALTLVNVEGNLRIATSSQNAANSGVRKSNLCGIKGVGFYKPTGKWRAMIAPQGKGINLGYFATPELAQEAYRKAAEKYFGEFSRTK